MATATVTSDYERKMLIKRIEGMKMPFTAELATGRHRTVEQNKLQRKWMTEVSEQLGETPEYWRGYCKLRFGVPILREIDRFREVYDRIIRPLPYDVKLDMMREPIDFQVTRLMTTAQKTKYLDEVYRHFSEQGVVLTLPPDKWSAAA